MDMRSFISQADNFESSSRPESYRLFTYYHPQLGVEAPSSRKGKSAIQWMTYGLDKEPKEPKKRREAVSLACYFCRKRKIACGQPPEGSVDRTCK